MATYFKTPFTIGSEYHYVEVKVPKIDSSSGNNIICCVDTSGSMSGSPIRNVCEVLRDIYQRTQIEYPLFTYNTKADITKTIKSVERQDLQAGGGTSFSSVFTAIQNYLVNNQKSTTFIFMTDGQDTDSQDALKRAIQMLKLTISGLSKSITVVFHVIGFGEVNNNFLNQVRQFGNKEGLFRYSTESAELQNNFNDMFEYAMSAREFTIVINGQSYTSSSNEETVGFLIDNITIDNTITKEIILKSSDGESKIPLELMQPIRPIHIVRALNLVSPDNETSVHQIRTYLNSIVPTASADLMEKLELEQIKKEIDERMMEYTRLFTQIKMGQVPEQVKLRLSALRHDATFANAQRRKKLDLRISKNVDYFRRTNISGILDGYKKSIDQDGWNKIKEQKSDWVCTYSNDDIYEMMRKTPDNIMCLGILIERNEQAIISPTKGLKLINVSNTIISYDSFIAAMTLSKNSQQQQQQQTDGTNYGQFSGINDTYCIVGQLHEKINAAIPLYINYEHMKRIRILEGIWLGYMFTLDSYGYDRDQEIGLLKLLYDMIILQTGTARNKQFITEFEKVCHFIITESIGFKSSYGEKTYDNFINSIHGRQNGKYDLSIPLIIGYLKNDLKNILMPVYYEYLRQCLHKKMPIDKTNIIERLLYGDESQRVKTVASNKDNTISIDINQQDPDYVEQSFIQYFHDEMCQPIELIPETTTGEDRKLIIHEADIEYIKNILQSIDSQLNLNVPIVIKNMLKYCNINENYIEDNLDYDDLRKELLMILYFDQTVPTNVTKSHVLSILDEKIQGNRDNTVTFNFTPETIRIVTYKMLTTKTLEGFGGLLRKYCPKRCGPLFSEVIKNLLILPQANEIERNVNSIMNKDKLVALLTNQIGYSQLYNNEMSVFCWQPLADVNIDLLAQVVGKDEFKKIEKDNLGKYVLHCYRISNKSNRHGYSNYKPNMNNKFKFTGYNDRY
ncbi:unnamed protein product [Rotaria sordida]|uniref:VWFA domain-containing protein n=1 Tax=Rotaria sordida TaxID=392033 RepID=A0A814UII5_9BILA|nr:unnamed protein product [Rotaria sordida]CAF3997291.1 unnamed protein product [Rotaria sordida]